MRAGGKRGAGGRGRGAGRCRRQEEGCGGERALLVHVALDADEVLAVAVHLVLLPLAFVLIRVGAAVLAIPVVHVLLPVALVHVAARERELTRAGALVILPLPCVLG